ncbi:PREDICTED: uncharacterized protein LOC109344531 [Lupinus angustifolius]|uniref:uncharacterized protein LOC109344531 n=1 Tax=Lupinus angustifolius TaxID=3871 RepID=UPI00092E53FE|nr:PREDICTED: uncharacterized protein LOC109344531 [Lupinus angustifolius]
MVENGTNLPSMGLPILTEKNWDRWRTQMKVLFSFQEISEVVEEGSHEPGPDATEVQRAIHKEVKKKDNKALFLIHQCVDDIHFEKIQNATTAKEAWDILIRSRQGGDKIKKVKLQTLRRQYELLNMEENDKIGEYFTKILAITNQMKGYGESIIDLMIIEKIMRSLPQKFDFIVVAIEESKDITIMKIEELQSSLEAHEMRLLDRCPSKRTKQALKASHMKEEDKKRDKKWRGKQVQNRRWAQNSERSKSNQDWLESSNRRGKPRLNQTQKRFDKKRVECFNCHKLGHYSYECLSDKAKQMKSHEEAYAVQEESDSEPLNLMVTTSVENHSLNHGT